MRDDSGYSRTAEGMALLRAVEFFRPPTERILEDPFAARFLRSSYIKAIGRSPVLARLYQAWFARFAPGVQATLVARARLVDDLACEGAQQGLRQIVILGAGFDTMSLRRRVELKDVTIYELDHPATQALKVDAMGTLRPPNVQFVPINFETEDLVEKLRTHGLNSALPVFVSWLGVTYYLTESAVEATFRRIQELSTSSLELVFDYLPRSVVDGTSSDQVALKHGKFIAKLGEPWLWGLEPSELAGFLAEHNFSLVREYDAAAIRKRYAVARLLAEYIRIAHCIRL